MAAMGQALQPHLWARLKRGQQVAMTEGDQCRGLAREALGSGYRLTPQRELILRAVETLGHATPDEVLARSASSRRRSTSPTVYRTLEVLEELGLVRHAHLSDRAPTYHSVTGHEHFHLVCRNCHRSRPVDPDVLDRSIDRLRATASSSTSTYDFGRCGSCDDGGFRGGRLSSVVEPSRPPAPTQGPPCQPAARPARRRRRRWHRRSRGRALRIVQRRAAHPRVRAGFVDLSHRDVLRIAGPDRLTWLHSLTTQHFDGLAPGGLDLGADPQPAGTCRARLLRRRRRRGLPGVDRARCRPRLWSPSWSG